MVRTITRAELARLARVSKPAITKWLKLHPDACEGERVKLDQPDIVAYLRAKGHEVTSAPQGEPLVAPAPAVGPPPDGAPTARPRKRTAASPPPPAAPAATAKSSRQRVDGPTAHQPSEPSKGKARGGARKRRGDDAPKPDESGFVDELADLTLRQICDIYGTVSAYKSHLEAHEKRERARKYWLDNETAEGRLVEREFMERVIGAFDGMNRKLLGDAPKTIVRRIFPMARSDKSTIEEAEIVVNEIVATILKSVKKAVREVIDRDG